MYNGILNWDYERPVWLARMERVSMPNRGNNRGLFPIRIRKLPDSDFIIPLGEFRNEDEFRSWLEYHMKDAPNAWYYLVGHSSRVRTLKRPFIPPENSGWEKPDLPYRNRELRYLYCFQLFNGKIINIRRHSRGKRVDRFSGKEKRPRKPFALVVYFNQLKKF